MSLMVLEVPSAVCFQVTPLPFRTRTTTTSSIRMGSIEMVVGSVVPRVVAPAAVAVAVGALGVKLVLDRPSRPYDEKSVAEAYDAWSSEGILEYYWGEHIHLGYYSEEEMERGFMKKDFIQAKYDFVDEMMKFGGIDAAALPGDLKVLDVGCGVGGTSRYIAKAFGPRAEVTGITLSPYQVKRGTELALEHKVPNAKFLVMVRPQTRKESALRFCLTF